VRASRVIYALLDDVLDLLADHLPVQLVDAVVAAAEVKAVFAVKGAAGGGRGEGAVAGCAVTEGTFARDAAKFRVVRDGVVVHEARDCTSLQHFKDKVTSVAKGRECGIALGANAAGAFADFRPNDRIQALSVTKKKQKILVNWG